MILISDYDGKNFFWFEILAIQNIETTPRFVAGLLVTTGDVRRTIHVAGYLSERWFEVYAASNHSMVLKTFKVVGKP
ncbi:MAG: hypothetical protein KatS3mg054_0164 [Chloroflexus sp.]|nr:MAG: hypothetical protein KatS3mg054_0164 [Chloroflexus sp.]